MSIIPVLILPRFLVTYEVQLPVPKVTIHSLPNLPPRPTTSWTVWSCRVNDNSMLSWELYRPDIPFTHENHLTAAVFMVTKPFILSIYIVISKNAYVGPDPGFSIGQKQLNCRHCRCNRLRCPLARMSGLQCFNMGHNGHGINLYGVSMTLMWN